MSVVRFAPSVVVKPTPAAARLIGGLDHAADVLNLDVYITSGAEVQNPPRKLTDPHMTGEAFDVRCKDYSDDDTLRLYQCLSSFFDPAKFTVLFEGATPHPDPRLEAVRYKNPGATNFHFHIQRRKGVSFP